MTSANPHPKSKNVHRASVIILFFMMAQPTFDNMRALATGTMELGSNSIDVTFSQMLLHIVAMAVGWVGWWWFYNRQKRGAYTSVLAHCIGFAAVLTQTPEMLVMMPPSAIVMFFAVLLTIAAGPIYRFKEEYR